jgi:hydroxyacylglutathione hydrolase
MLRLKSFKGGYDDNFSYILFDEDSKEAGIIDIAIEPGILLKFIVQNGLKVKFVVIMHSHFDHMVGYDEYREKGIKIAASEDFKGDVDISLADGDTLSLGGSTIKVMKAPGHIYDCVCLLVEGKLFTTDVLFIDGCGRCDLAGSEIEKMYETLQKIKKLTDETMIYPGHDYGNAAFESLAEQKKSNPYLKIASLNDFLNLRK